MPEEVLRANFSAALRVQAEAGEHRQESDLLQEKDH